MERVIESFTKSSLLKIPKLEEWDIISLLNTVPFDEVENPFCFGRYANLELKKLEMKSFK